jgi:hypothetical protein
MTRGVLAIAHGDMLRAAALNPGSILLVLVGIVSLALIVTARRPRVSVPTWLPLAVITALWAFQLFKYSTGRPL